MWPGIVVIPLKTRPRAAVGPFSFPVRILDVPLHRKIFSKPMQRDRMHARGFADPWKSRTAGEWNGACARQNLWRVKQKYFVHYIRRERCPIHQCAAFD